MNLKDAAKEFVDNHITLPNDLPDTAPLMTRIHDHMFRAHVMQLKGEDGKEEESKAFGLLREGLIDSISGQKQYPKLAVYSDQIVWGRSPVRIDLAGGWTDTPPYCLYSGGNVVNMAIELNGQPPLQVYVKPSKEYKIILRSIDLGAIEIITSYEQLMDFNKVGSPFSIPKACVDFGGILFCISRRMLSFIGRTIESLRFRY